jgi:hypothetical protein
VLYMHLRYLAASVLMQGDATSDEMGPAIHLVRHLDLSFIRH